jgi:prolyl-tRNA editing enzyme YbaK/EbsC (Cys-tRNA(Pro) deacylase)
VEDEVGALSTGIQAVQAALRRGGWPHQIHELPRTTRRASDAAAALGCSEAQIAKSLLFRGGRSGRPLLVIASGINRVDEAALAMLAGEPIEKATADFVKERTGFVIGGVSPVGMSEPLPIYIDRDLLGHATIWAAAGGPNAVFQLRPSELVAMTGGQVVAIAAAT